jgi:hypothetical protein
MPISRLVPFDRLRAKRRAKRRAQQRSESIRLARAETRTHPAPGDGPPRGRILSRGDGPGEAARR